MSKLEKERDAPSCRGEGQAQISNEVYVLIDDKPQVPLFVVDEKAVLLLQKHATKSSGGFFSFPECRRVFS